MCLTHQNAQCYQCAFEKFYGGKAETLICKTMKKTVYDRKVADKTSEIREKIDDMSVRRNLTCCPNILTSTSFVK